MISCCSGDRLRRLLSVVTVVFAAASLTVFSFDAPEVSLHAEMLLIEKDHSLLVTPSLDMYFFRDGESAADYGMQVFYHQYGHQWDVFWDARSDRPELISGQGIPFVPGPGNHLVDRCAYGYPADDLTPYSMADLAMRFMLDNPELLRVDPGMLEIHPQATRSAGVNNRLWFVHFRQVHDNVLVKDAGVFFRINSGNLTQMGSHRILDIPADFNSRPAISSNKAMDISINHALTAIDGDLEIVTPPELYIVPVFGEGRDGLVGELYQGVPGRGYGARLVWEMRFRMEPHIETWYSMVDAQTGELLHFEDDNRYGAIYGGVYLEDNISPEGIAPFPYAATSQGTGTSGGRLDYPGGNVSCTLNGQYVRISDTCGSISLTSATGDLNFGTSSASNCSTPGFGGSGNTRATRTAFYHVNDIVMKARGYLPTNNWLQGKLLTNVNINNTCNAFWDGTSINFYRQGGGCSNTGELSPVVVHEWGHGLDSNTSFTSSDHSSSEALADSMSFLQLHISCVGHNFRPGIPCPTGCDSTCTGVRDPAVRPFVRPSTIESSPVNCNCSSSYRGVMGYQGHCESHIASGAVWDMAVKLANAKGDAGWTHANRLFFESINDTQGAYRLVSGGLCNPNAVVDGCGSRNWFTVWLFADDDNGNLADGTPNGCLIWDAFNDHGIACGSRPVCYTVCPPIAAPNLVVLPGDNSATLSWQPVANASYYIVFRNSAGCQFERAIIGTTAATQYTDNTLANDFTYYYSVQAVGSNDSCRSVMSACIEISPGLSSYGVIAVDKSFYGGNDTIVIEVADLDLLGDGIVNVTVESDSQPAGQTVTLTEIAGPSGIFSGSIMTTPNSGVPGKITVSHGDEIRAIYFDEDIGNGMSAFRTATAYADLMPPAITNVTVTNIGSESFTVTWNTSEPADSVLYWGNMIPPVHSVVSSDFTTTHQIPLTNLSAGTEYFLMIQSTDVAGNMAVDDNGGMYYRATTLYILWDQPVSPSNPGRVANQAFPDYPGYTSYLADDFINTEIIHIRQIFVPGQLYNGGTSLMNAVSLHWRIYADASGFPSGNPSGGGSAPFWSLDLAPTNPQVSVIPGLQGNLSDTSLTLDNPIILPPGTWWLIFYPTMSFSPNGQFGRLSSDTTNLSIGKFINPGGSFGHGTSWQNWSVMGVTQHDISFRLSGLIPSMATPTPAPTSTPTVTPTPDPSECLNHGDVNFDGAITAGDAQMTFFIVLGMVTPTYEEACAADCNGDGLLTAADAQKIFLAALGSETCADPL